MKAIARAEAAQKAMMTPHVAHENGIKKTKFPAAREADTGRSWCGGEARVHYGVWAPSGDAGVTREPLHFVRTGCRGRTLGEILLLLFDISVFIIKTIFYKRFS